MLLLLTLILTPSSSVTIGPTVAMTPGRSFFGSVASVEGVEPEGSRLEHWSFLISISGVVVVTVKVISRLIMTLMTFCVVASAERTVSERLSTEVVLTGRALYHDDGPDLDLPSHYDPGDLLCGYDDGDGGRWWRPWW